MSTRFLKSDVKILLKNECFNANKTRISALLISTKTKFKAFMLTRFITRNGKFCFAICVFHLFTLTFIVFAGELRRVCETLIKKLYNSYSALYSPSLFFILNAIKSSNYECSECSLGRQGHRAVVVVAGSVLTFFF